MPSPRRLLFLAQTLPFPPDGGVEIRTYNVLRQLARDYEVTALCFYRRAARPSTQHVHEGLRGLAMHARAEAFSIPQEHSRLRFLWDHLRSLMMGRVYTAFAYDSRMLRNRLRELLRSERFDIIHLDSLDLSAYMDELPPGIPVVCAHHNVESRLLQRRAQVEASAVRRTYLGLQARLMAREERRWCPRVALNTAVSSDDRAEFARLTPEATFEIVPNGVDTSVFVPAPPSTPTAGIVFVGGYSWFPNRDALDHFCQDVLPHLAARGVHPAVRWVGRAPDEVRTAYKARYGVELTGYVEDIRPLVHSASCYVVPLRVGGGTRLKILDAWALGKAVVSTSVGCEGLDTRDGENILIRDDPAHFAAAVEDVLKNRELREALGRGGRRTAEEVYSWEIIGARMRRQYAGLLSPGTPPSTGGSPPARADLSCARP